ncbi:MAG: hypothetical protein WCR87_08525, partial [Saccharofermentanales bacterium]
GKVLYHGCTEEIDKKMTARLQKANKIIEEQGKSYTESEVQAQKTNKGDIAYECNKADVRNSRRSK